MSRYFLRTAGLACLAGIVLIGGLRPRADAAQHDERSLPADFNEPIRIYTTSLGIFTRPISSPNAEAQAYFNQGVRLMYAFAKLEAGRSFREAERRDPACAICYWGEAWAWGPYVNGRMTAHDAQRAYAAIQKALSLIERASPSEKALIEAMGVRYAERFDAETRITAQDRAYADAMSRVAAAYPADLDIATLYAEALFLLLPRPGMQDLVNSTVARLLGVLEATLKRDV